MDKQIAIWRHYLAVTISGSRSAWSATQQAGQLNQKDMGFVGIICQAKEPPQIIHHPYRMIQFPLETS